MSPNTKKNGIEGNVLQIILNNKKTTNYSNRRHIHAFFLFFYTSVVVIKNIQARAHTHFKKILILVFS